MAIRTVLVDDMDGGDADVTIAFVINGESYSIDLSQANADRFHKLIGPYIEAASRKTQDRQSAINDELAGVEQRAIIRDWARKNGIEVSSRGRIPQDVIEQYRQGNETRP